MNDTKQKILDTAEELFGENGYATTSLRHVIAKAGVNLAAIHYHFGTKQDLLDQVILRKVGPINERRLKLLDQFEAEAAPSGLSIEKIMEAFLAPPILMERGGTFIKLMGRVHAEGMGQQAVQRNFQPVISRFQAALKHALPGMPEKELAWKVHFMLGAMAYTMITEPAMLPADSHEPLPVIAKRLVTFVSAGFRTPVILEETIEVNQ
jgi:AcrR family transcriptional regulator